jgi:phthiocerol/phenolphthiocerol synthesis type-I polyketide synthase E
MSDVQQAGEGTGSAVAVVGMAGRFPGAGDVERFWSNLREGVHSITFFRDEELRAAGVDPALLRNPDYVRAGGVLEGIDLFDAAFFGFNPREAEVIDPQHRVFLETAWEALENAGCDPEATDRAIGIYAGSSTSHYLSDHVLAHPEIVEAVGAYQVHIGNAKDFLATRAAYKLNLRGPALAVQTGCSTGLVAVHVACQALLNGECDVALAGGVSINLGQEQGYLYSPGGVLSPDGHCRAFDARAGGALSGSGAALVVLKRLEDALADGDTIHAVVRGSAVNNDGAQKVGFTAPSVDGQAAVIEEALAVADVDPATVGFVEAHGTGTDLGDPIEVAALVQAFGDTGGQQHCALGAVKTNIGHLDAAAGTAGMIKAVLALEHGEIPPTLHFTAPNPKIPFAGSPFFVNTELRRWDADGHPRRAGVSSFGIGGTNAHVVLEEAPEPEPSEPARPWHLLTLSAKTASALEAATARLAAHLRAHPEQDLADVAWTLQAGRRAWEHRRVLLARDGEDAAAALEARSPERVLGAASPEGARPVAFLFAGVGDHYPQMGRGLYETEPVFRETVDLCAEILRPHLGADLRDTLYPGDAPADAAASAGIDLRAMLGRAAAGPDAAAERLNGTRMAQAALFVTEYALARQWMAWGVAPEAMIGHSLGEYVAATVAGVWSLEDALALVAERSRLIEEMPEGAMLGLPLSEAEVRPLLRGGLAVATVNGPAMTVVSGPVEEVAALEAEMAGRGAACRRLPTRHAFHSPMMAPVAERLAERMRRVRLSAPSIPFVSNVTGTWIRADEATDPAYWTRHLCGTVRFAEGIETLAGDGRRVLLEIGPGQTLGTFVRQRPLAAGAAEPTVVASLRHGYERHPDVAFLLGAAGRLWLAGVPVDWKAMHAHERLRRVPLPTYPFERKRFWIEPRSASASTPTPEPRGGDPLAKKPDPAEWLYLPAWKRAPLPAAAAPSEPSGWLVLADEAGIGARLAARLEAAGHTAALVEAGDRFAAAGERAWTARPGSADDLAALRDALRAAGIRPRHVVDLWGIDPEGDAAADVFGRAQARGYATVAALARTFAADRAEGPLRLTVVAEGVQDVAGGETVRPERATVLGACVALPQEQPHVACRAVDVELRAGGAERLVEQLFAEVVAESADTVVAYRGARRWARSYEAVRPAEGSALRQNGVYLFSGGLAGGSEVLAAHLAERFDARLAVVVDPAFPERERWDAHLASAEDDAAPTIHGIRDAESRGAEVLLLRAAPGDGGALRAAVAEAGRRFGALHGIVHAFAPGAAAERVTLADARPEDAAADFARLARELAALEEATEGVPLDFCVLQNSLLAVFGGAGLGAAAAASLLVDAWAQRHAAESGGRWTGVDWDRWHLDEDGDALAGTAFDERAMLRAEGARAFELAAGLAGEPRVVVSTHDLAARIEQFLAPRAAPAPPAGEAALHARPELGTAYHAPTGDAEEILVRMWSDLLGIAEIGVHDDFFHLGGHSLLATQLISRVRETFQVELPLRAIFEAPTVARLAAVIEEAIILELEQMSDEEAMSLI